MEWIVDRIEENIAVLECGSEMFEINVLYLPQNVKEGDVIKLTICETAKQNKLETAKEKMNRIFSKER